MPAGERRQLTVLFCDLVGSTELSARLDPEEWYDVAAGYQQAAASAVSRFGGYVARYLGDGILAYFGWPQAHDEDPERAVRGGLAVLEAVKALNPELEADHGLRLAVRVGIHTGPVVMGTGGGEDMDVFGETPNLAARLQGVAAPDTVVISDATLRLVRGIFVTADLGPQAMKGLPGPVVVHRVVQPSGVRSRLDVAGTVLTSFVGRGHELGILLERWERMEARDGQVVLIVGEPGVGKSRLVRELRERLRDVAHTWLECGCSPYGEHTAFHPVIQLLEGALAFEADDQPEEKLHKLRGGLTRAGLSLPEAMPLLAAFLSIAGEDAQAALGMSPELWRRKTLEALVSWGLTLGTMQPTVLLVEDLHWCDPSSLELLGQLIERTSTARIMLVCTARPEFEPPWSQHPRVTTVGLNRLDTTEARAMGAAVSAGRPLPDAVLDLIVARADGIPLYVEELARTVLESGMLVDRAARYELSGAPSALAIPATLQDSLMARLDRLSAAKDVAQRAAALGREFPYELLEAVAELDVPMLRHGLARLVEAEMLFVRGEPPVATYAFKHALIQEAAYQSMLKRTRQALHARIARTFEDRFPARAAAEPELMARHCELGGLVDHAVSYYQRAGEQAAARSAHEEAIVDFRRGLALLSSAAASPDRQALERTLQLALGPSIIAARGYAHPETRATWGDSRALCEATGDDRGLAYALVGLSICHSSGADFTAGVELAEQLLALAGRTQDDAHRILAHVQIAVPTYFQGRFATSLEHCQQASACYDAARHGSLRALYGTDQGVAAAGYAAWDLWHLGYPVQAQVGAREGIDLARTLGHPFSLAHALFFEAVVLYLVGRGEALLRTLDDVITLSHEHRFPFWLGLARVFRGATLIDSDPQTAVAEISDGLSQAAATGNQAGAPPLIAMLALAHRAAGQHAEAMSALELALAVSAQTGQPHWDAELHRERGELLLACGADGAAEAARGLFERALTIARAQRARSQELRAATSLARLLCAHGARDAARRTLVPIADWFSEGRDSPDVRAAVALLAALG